MTRELAWFLGGLLASVGFVLTPGPGLKALWMLAFLGLCLARGRRVRVLAMLLTCLAILAFNLFPPLGRELFALGGYPVTAGALEVGADRALLFEGLLLVSRATVAPSLRLPGSLGRLLGETFRWFGLLSGHRARLTWREPIASLDALLEELEAEGLLWGETKPPASPEG